MAFVKKVWKNRISEFFNRYRLENVKTGEAFNAYINLNDGAVEEQGDRLNAESLNDLEQRIEDGFNSVESYDYSVMIAGTESTSISSQAYAIGQFLVYNKLLYKVISPIAQGGTLTVGTNIQLTKVANELSNHLAVNGTEFYFDTHDGEFGYNTSESRGADTFHPFKSGVEQATVSISVSGKWKVGGDGSVSPYCRASVNVNGYTYSFNISYGKRREQQGYVDVAWVSGSNTTVVPLV